MWRSAFDQVERRRRSVAGAIALAFSVAAPLAVRADTTTSTTMGADLWHTPTEPARYLPNYSTPNPWRAVTPWVRAQIQHGHDTDWGLLTVTAGGKTDPIFKGRVDRLDVGLHTVQGGVRVGILPYRVSWCRADGGPWISEPDAFCRFAGLNEVSQGAFGLQAYRSTMAGGFLIDAMVGIYRPKVDGQNDKLGPYVSVGPTVKHHAHGLSVNGLHLASGIEARAGWLRTAQDQDSDAGSYQRRMRYDSYYLATQGNITPRLDLRTSVSAYMGEQANPALPYGWDGISKTMELIYKPDSTQSLAAGLSRYTNITTYSAPPNGQALQVDSVSVAWRKDWPGGFYTVLQTTRSLDDATTRRGVQTVRQGNAWGLRVARSF